MCPKKFLGPVYLRSLSNVIYIFFEIRMSEKVCENSCNVV